MLRLLRKPSLLFFLLVPYLVSIMGVAVYFFAFQYRHTFQELIRSTGQEDLQAMHFSARDYAAIEWTEAKREFTLDGKMYDVAFIEKTEGGYNIFCENDTFEEAIIAWMKVNGEKSKSKSNVNVQFFELADRYLHHREFIELQNKDTRYLSLYHSYYPELSTPPPRVS